MAESTTAQGSEALDSHPKDSPSAEAANKRESSDSGEQPTSRRDFLNLTAMAMGAVGAGAVAWPLIDSLNPAADVLALASIEVDIASIPAGQAITAKWRGKPVFIRHRTEQEIEAARSVDVDDLIDPEADAARTKEAQWLIVVGICTHLGCVPVGNKPNQQRGEYGGWFCPCHGSHYDTSGRIRKGPAPINLLVPPYQLTDNGTVVIG